MVAVLQAERDREEVLCSQYTCKASYYRILKTRTSKQLRAPQNLYLNSCVYKVLLGTRAPRIQSQWRQDRRPRGVTLPSRPVGHQGLRGRVQGHGWAARGCGRDVGGTRKQVRQRSPRQGLACAVGALGGAGRTGLAEHAVLAGPQDGARPLPTHHALLRPQLEDHLWARHGAPSGWGRLSSRGHPGARREREDPP